MGLSALAENSTRLFWNSRFPIVLLATFPTALILQTTTSQTAHTQKTRQKREENVSQVALVPPRRFHSRLPQAPTPTSFLAICTAGVQVCSQPVGASPVLRRGCFLKRHAPPLPSFVRGDKVGWGALLICPCSQAFFAVGLIQCRTATKKAVGSTKNGRDSNAQYLGVKTFGAWFSCVRCSGDLSSACR